MSYLTLPTFDLHPLRLFSEEEPNVLKTVGVIGGLAPQSTSLFYDEVTRICITRGLSVYPQLLLNSVNCLEVVNILSRRDMEGLFQYLSHEIGLFQERADFMVMVCNSVHAVLEQLRVQLPIPIMAIHEEVCKDIALQNIKRVGILGTQTTIENAFYQNELDSYGIDHCILPAEQVAAFDHFIFAEMIHGRGKGTMKRLILEGIRNLEQQGCEAVILGCTELQLFVSQKDSAMPLFLSTQILARATVEASYGRW